MLSIGCNGKTPKKNHFYYLKKVNFTNVEFSHISQKKKKMIKFTNIIKYEFFLFFGYICTN